MPSKLTQWLAVGCAVLLASTLVMPTVAQEARVDLGGVVQAGKSNLIVRNYPIKFATAESLVPVIQTVFSESPNLRISADARLNSLIAFANSEEHERLDALIRELDVPGVKQESIETFHLDNEMIEAAQSLLKLVGDDLEIAATDGILLVRGDRESLQQASDLIHMLESSREKKTKNVDQSVRDVMVEVVWLTEAKLDNIPPLVGPVALVLEKRGFDPVVEFGTLQVSTVVGGRATAIGAAHTGKMEVQVTVDELPSTKELQIMMDLEAELNSQPVRFSTVVNVPLNHWVVFGVAAPSPTDAEGEKSPKSVFLMRLKPRDDLMIDSMPK